MVMDITSCHCVNLKKIFQPLIDNIAIVHANTIGIRQ